MGIATPNALKDKSKRDHNKQKPGIAAELPPSAPTPPDYLTESAKLEWIFIVKCFAKYDLYTEIDKGLLETYCRYMALWRKAIDDVELQGTSVMNAGKIVVNPQLTAANSMMQQLNKMMAAMGLTPAARSAIRVANPKEDVPIDLEEFL